jgi:biotin-(acetyl-CoA carboxylase) ligase
MKRYIFLIALFLIITSERILAQDSLRVEKYKVAVALTERVSEELNLSQNQKKQLLKVFKERSDAYNKAATLRKNKKDLLKADVKQIDEDTLIKVKKILNEDQLKSFIALRKDKLEQKKSLGFDEDNLNIEDLELNF